MAAQLASVVLALVMMNGEPVNSCMVLAVECEGAEDF